MRRIYLKQLLTALLLLCSTVASAATYDDWTSTNKTDGSTSDKTYTILANEGDVLSFDWVVSSESGYDKLIVTINGTEVLNKSGENSGTYTYIFTSSDSHTLVVQYTKDSSVSRGDDYGKIYNITTNTQESGLLGINGVCGDNLTWNLFNDTLTISGSGAMTDFSFSDDSTPPWYYNSDDINTVIIEDGVTSIGDNAFYNCTSLRNIVIPNSVTSIGTQAFSWCCGLASITIPNSVTSIGGGAFTFSGLKSIIIAEGVTNIGGAAFHYCDGLESIVIPKSVTSIGDAAFYNCHSLQNVEFNAENCTSMGSEKYPIFENCTSLSNIIIGEKVKSIPSYAFTGCYLIESITIPSSVTTIGEKAFNGCYIKNITIPENVTSIGVGAFNDCSNLQSVEFNAENCTSMGSEKYPIFENCTSLSNIIIGEKVKSIPSYAFTGCYLIESITIPNSVTTIGEKAFYDCSYSLESINVSNENTEYYSSDNCNAIIETKTNTLILGCKNTNIPNSVTSIGDYAFYNCSHIESITIPNSVTNIGDLAFYNCRSLKSIIIPESVTSIGDKALRGCNSLESIVIPNSVTSIGDGAFEFCSSLKSVTIGNSVTNIGNSAFSSCSSLKSVTIGNSVTNIGDYAFYNCRSLKSIIIPESVTSIGDKALRGCNSLESIIIANRNTKYDSRDNCNAIIETKTNTLILGCKNTNIPNSVTSIGDSAFAHCSSLESIVIPNSVTSIGDYAFCECNSLECVTIGNSVTSIGNGAFEFCSSLECVTIGNSVTSIGDYAFFVCNALESITIPESVTSIGNGAFEFCSSLESIVIPNSVTSIGGNAFSMCGLTSIIIAEGVTNIGGGAFHYCDRLKSIVIPNSVTNIGNSAFSSCSSLKSVTIGNSVTNIGDYAFYGCDRLESVTSLIPADKLFGICYYEIFGNNYNNIILYVPAGAKATYTTTEEWNFFANIVEIEVTEVTITINQYGCATYCSPYALDFSEVEGLKAYAATGYNKVTQVVTLTRLQTSQEGTGLFLTGAPGKYIVPVIDGSNDYSLNLLVGTLEQTIINSTDGDKSNYKFTITAGDAAPMFYPFEDKTSFSAGKAYLQIPTAWIPPTAQRAMSIRFDNGAFTDIEDIVSEGNDDDNFYYDLNGRKVENPSSGIYIKNGKKVFIK